MGKYYDKHGYTRFQHWIGLNGQDFSEWMNRGVDKVGSFLSDAFDRLTNGGSELSNQFSSFINQYTGAHATGMMREQNEMQMQNVEDQYSRQVQGMQRAGLNPALMYQNGSSSSAPSAPSNTASGSLSDIMQIAMLPLQMKMMDSQIAGQDLSNKEKEIGLEFLRDEKLTSLAFTREQINAVVSQLENDKVHRALERAGISKSEAETWLMNENAALAHTDNATRAQLNDLMLQYRAAEIAYTNQKTEESKKNMDVLKAQVTELYSRSVLESAEAGLYSAEEQNALIQAGILQLDKESKKFSVDHQQAQYNWEKADMVVGMVTDVGKTVANFFGLGKLGKAAKGLTQGSVLYEPSGFNQFGQHYSNR